jgi:large repetitive protein
MKISQIAGGLEHTCGLTPGGEVYCTGNSSVGQVGDGTTDGGHLAPRKIDSQDRYTALVSGWYHTCALTGTGAAHCWGLNSRGQSGGGTRDPQRSPVEPTGGLKFIALDVGELTTCGITTSGELYCWGQLPTQADVATSDPSHIAFGWSFKSVAVGSGFVCGISTDSRLLCWGSNDYGQLGNGSTTTDYTPRVVSEESFTSVSAGRDFVCATDALRAAHCWGRNHVGQLGNGSILGGPGDDTPATSAPSKVKSAIGFASIEAATTHACGIGLDGKAYCWGQTINGRFGNSAGVVGCLSSGVMRSCRPEPGPVR